jgi:pilus assembly protein CpaB
MKKHPLVNALLLALLISSTCTYVLSRRQTGHSQTLWVPENQYVAPSRPLQAGEALKAEDMELVPWPAANPLPGAAARPAQLVGRIVLYPLEKGEPILERTLAAPGSVAGLSSKIPDGQRAIALKSDEVVGVGGFLIPGSRVDVLVSYRTDKLPEPITATVVQDAVVLAAGQQIEPDPAGKPTAVTVVTLLLTPQESERAFLASNQGAIHFVLRNGSDRGRAAVEPVSLSQLSSGTTGVPAGLAVIPVTVKSVAQGTLPHPVKEMEIETVLGDGKSSSRPDGGN